MGYHPITVLPAAAVLIACSPSTRGKQNRQLATGGVQTSSALEAETYVEKQRHNKDNANASASSTGGVGATSGDDLGSHSAFGVGGGASRGQTEISSVMSPGGPGGTSGDANSGQTAAGSQSVWLNRFWAQVSDSETSPGGNARTSVANKAATGRSIIFTIDENLPSEESVFSGLHQLHDTGYQGPMKAAPYVRLGGSALVGFRLSGDDCPAKRDQVSSCLLHERTESRAAVGKHAMRGMGFCTINSVMLKETDSLKENVGCQIEIRSLPSEVAKSVLGQDIYLFSYSSTLGGDHDGQCRLDCLQWDMVPMAVELSDPVQLLPFRKQQGAPGDQGFGDGVDLLWDVEPERRFCGLAGVEFRDIDRTESVGCRIGPGKVVDPDHENAYLDSQLALRPRGLVGEDNFASCNSICLSWPRFYRKNFKIEPPLQADVADASSGSVAWTRVLLGSDKRRFCALTDVKMRDLGSKKRRGYCNVERQDGSWVVEASTGEQAREQNLIVCEAQCLSWDSHVARQQ